MTSYVSPRKSAVTTGPARKWYVPMCSISSRRCTGITSFNPSDPLTSFEDLNEKRGSHAITSQSRGQLPADCHPAKGLRDSPFTRGLRLDASRSWHSTATKGGGTAGVRALRRLETYCLFVPNAPNFGRNGGGPRYAVMESVRHNDEAPAGTCWMPSSAAADCSDAGEAAAIRESLEELDSYVRGQRPGPFAKPGWLRELFSWAQEQVAPLGLRVTGGFRQWNASPSFSLVRMETNDGALWFKATGEPNSHEMPVSLLLARLFPNHLPRILGIHRLWNGWLSAEVSGAALDEISDCFTWERVAQGLAELQIASIGKSRELLEGKCKDFRVAEIVKSIDPFLSRMAEFMAAQEKTSPAPLANSELASLGEGLKESCSLLQSFGLPDTLGHID